MARKKAPARRVVGIGGVFLRAKDPKALAGWYRDHLGMQIRAQVLTYEWKSPRGAQTLGATVWATLSDDEREWGPAHPTAMINYRVRDLATTLALLRAEGVTVDERTVEDEYGRFGWATDPEGNRVELWEPPARYRSPEHHEPME